MVAGVKEKEDDLVQNFEKLKIFAFAQMSYIAKQEMAKRFKLKTVSDTYQITNKYNAAYTTPMAAEERGLLVTTGSGAFNKIHIKDIKIYSPINVVTTINVYDATMLDNLSIIETQSKQLVAGWNTIPFLKSYYEQAIFISYDSTAIDSVQLLINDLGGCGCDWNCVGCGLSIMGGQYNGISVARSNNSFGMSGTISMVCDYSKVLCHYTEDFAELFMWFTGIEFMKERLVSDRLNRWTTVDADKANQWLSIYKDEKENQLRSLFNNIELKNDCCVECNPKITTSTWL